MDNCSKVKANCAIVLKLFSYVRPFHWPQCIMYAFVKSLIGIFRIGGLRIRSSIFPLARHALTPQQSVLGTGFSTSTVFTETKSMCSAYFSTVNCSTTSLDRLVNTFASMHVNTVASLHAKSPEYGLRPPNISYTPRDNLLLGSIRSKSTNPKLDRLTKGWIGWRFPTTRWWSDRLYNPSWEATSQLSID